MTIDETIEDLKYDNEIDMYIHAIAPEIAEWLEELKAYKETGLTSSMVKDLIKSKKQAHKDAVHNAFLVDEAYSKAIDDLIAKCESAKFADDDETILSDIHQGTNSGLSMAIHFAKKLKGERNDD